MSSRAIQSVEIVTFPPLRSSDANFASCRFGDRSDLFEGELLSAEAGNGSFLRGLAFALCLEASAALAVYSAWQTLRLLF